MDFENNENKNEIAVVETTTESEDIPEINKITDSFFEKNYKSTSNNNFNNNFNSFSSNSSSDVDSINLTLDVETVKNIKFIATVIKIFSVLGIISGVFQLILLFLGVFTILISIKFLKAATALEEALYAKDENKLKLYFSEQAKGFKLYIIFIIVIMVLTALFYGIVIIFALLQASSSSV